MAARVPLPEATGRGGGLRRWMLYLAVAALVLAARPARADDARTIAFTGEVARGETYVRALGGGLEFRLAPEEFGWIVEVRDPARPDENLARLTPPWHFVPNPRYLEGWHFRNADNTGPNEGSVNAPQHERDFIFSPAVGLTVGGADDPWPPTEAQMAAVRAAGRGTLTIRDKRLGNLEPGARAHFEWMRFDVEIVCTVCGAPAAAAED